MIEYDNGKFSEPGPLKEMIDKFSEELEEGVRVKALHVGTHEELLQKRGEPVLKEKVKTLEDQLVDLAEKLDKLQVKPSSHFPHVRQPTADEIEIICKDWSTNTK